MMSILFYIGLISLLGAVSGQSSAGLPKRELVVTGGQFTAETYIDVGAFTAPVFPLDDRGTCRTHSWWPLALHLVTHGMYLQNGLGHLN